MRIITNGHHRDVIDGYQLTADQRAELDYIDWSSIDQGTDSASFVIYRGSVYDLGEFSSTAGLSQASGMPSGLEGWDGYISDSFYSGIVVRYVDDFEGVVVGTFLT